MGRQLHTGTNAKRQSGRRIINNFQSMLINLSNHPSENWGEKQKNEAMAKYKSVVDLPFPHIEPTESIEEVSALAYQYVNKILEMFQFDPNKPFDRINNAVHVMGEMTFTHNVVRQLGYYAITCLASTSQRNVIKESNGLITSVFEFVQFRSYTSDLEVPY